MSSTKTTPRLRNVRRRDGCGRSRGRRRAACRTAQGPLQALDGHVDAGAEAAGLARMIFIGKSPPEFLLSYFECRSLPSTKDAPEQPRERGQWSCVDGGRDQSCAGVPHPGAGRSRRSSRRRARFLERASSGTSVGTISARGTRSRSTKLSRVPSVVAADEDGVLVAAAADDADVALIGPDAAVGAAGHAHADRLVCPGPARLSSASSWSMMRRQRALRLGDGQAAGRDRRAGHAVAAARCEIWSGRTMPCSASIRSIRPRSSAVEVAQQHVLHRRQAQLRLKSLDDGPQARPQAQSPSSLIAAVLDAEAVEPLAVALRLPAQMQRRSRVTSTGRGKRSGHAQIVGQHLAELLDAPVVDQVLDARPLAVGAVAVIAEQLDDRLGRRRRPASAGT